MASKYRNKRTRAGGIIFDSKREAMYYLKLLAAQQKGSIKEIELQPKFLLQRKFTKNGINFPAITYKADFKVTYADGSVEIIDIKGMSTPVFKLKHKMFEFVYPDLSLKIVK